VAKLMADAGLIVIVSFISPYRAERRMARELFEGGEFIEVFVDTPVEICEARDVKGLYAKARAGQLANFTGVTAPYEVPERPDLHLRAAAERIEQLVDHVIAHLSETRLLQPEPS
jgi:bifunctional enzyme CysN/CysC